MEIQGASSHISPHFLSLFPRIAAACALDFDAYRWQDCLVDGRFGLVQCQYLFFCTSKKEVNSVPEASFLAWMRTLERLKAHSRCGRICWRE